MAKQNPPEPNLTVNRRQILVIAAAVTATGIVPDKPTEAVTPAEVAITPAPLSVSHPPALNVCASTARRIEEIVVRNRIREKAGLPLLSIPKELRKIKNTELAAKFEEFADRHRQAVWDEILTPIREAKGDPNWRPKGMMEGLGYQAQVSKVLRERFVAQ